MRTTVLYPGMSVSVDNLPSWTDKMSFTSVVNGDFKSPNPFTMVKENQYSYLGNVSKSEVARYGGNLAKTQVGNSGIMVPFFLSSTGVSNNTYNTAISRMNAKLRSSVDLSVDLAQSGMVVKMLRDAGKTLSYVKRFRPSDLRQWKNDFDRFPEAHFRNFATGVSSKWLEFQYGWKPFASTIFGTSQNLTNVVQQPFKVRVRSNGVAKWVFTESISTENSARMTVDVERSERFEISARFAPKPSAFTFLSNFASVNPASIAWELTPFSFVVDWFLDIGGYLRNVETAAIYSRTFKDGYTTFGERISAVGRPIVMNVTKDPYVFVYNLSNGRSIRHTKVRSLLTSMPVTRVPRFKLDLGAGRLLNAAALLAQHLKLKR